jgi:hypothetical protein
MINYIMGMLRSVYETNRWRSCQDIIEIKEFNDFYSSFRKIICAVRDELGKETAIDWQLHSSFNDNSLMEYHIELTFKGKRI